MKNHILLSFIILYGLIISACSPAEINTPIVQPSVFDPNISAVQAQLTANAAQDQAQIFGQMATGTAQAPIIAITQTAADFAIQQAYAAATSTAAAQTQVAAYTSTAQSWTPTPNATMTAVFAQSYAEATQIANIAIEDNQRIERVQLTNRAKAFSLYAVGIVALLVGVAFAYTHIKKLAYIPNPVDERGKPQPMIEVVNAVAWDIDRSTNGVIGATQTFLKSLPAITAERQDLVTEHAQMVDMQTRIAKIPKRLLEAQSLKFLSAPESEEESLEAAADMHDAELLLPAWNVINGWDGQSRPLGLGRKGIIVAQAASPHLLTTGGTGSGKTAFMLRTQATASLAKGYQVINLGFSDSGFGVFASHPNFHSIKLSQSSDVIDCLASVYKELKERKQIIGGESIEWEHWRAGELPPRPFVDVLIDELGNLADDIYTSEETSKEGAVKTMMLWRWMSMIAKEGRKVGIRFLAALQDPTAKSVNLSFRRNCTLVSFQLGDASQSRSFIGVAGAELLQVGHFMTRNFSGNEGVIVGGGFAPTDDEIKAYLRLHPVPQTPVPNWIEGVLVNQPTLPGSEAIKLSAPAPVVPTQSLSEFVNGLSEWEVQALDLYQAGLDQEQIVATVFAGDNPIVGKSAVADLIKRWQVVKGVTPANSQQTQEPSQIDPVAARDSDIIHRYFDLHQSKAQIQREVFGDQNTGGVNHQKIKTVIERHEAATTKPTTTDENKPIFPNLGNVAMAS